MIESNLDVLMFLNKTNKTKISKELGIRSNTLSDIEKNNIKHIPVEVLDKLCRYFKCQPGDIFTYTEILSSDMQTKLSRVNYLKIED